MAAAQGHLADGPDNGGGDEAPAAFLSAVEGLRGARLRPELEVAVTRAPARLAPHAYALEAAVVQEDEDLADGRLILLHDPAGHDAWQGTFRLVTLVRAELEPEMAGDPLLPEVCWSWLTGAFEARGVAHEELSGTVTLAGSHYFGGLGDRPRPPRSRSAPPGPRARAARAYRTRPRTSPPGASCSARSAACPRRAAWTRPWSPSRSAGARAPAEPRPAEARPLSRAPHPGSARPGTPAPHRAAPAAPLSSSPVPLPHPGRVGRPGSHPAPAGALSGPGAHRPGTTQGSAHRARKRRTPRAGTARGARSRAVP